MEEIKNAVEAGSPYATLVGKILGLWPARRRVSVQSIAAAEADAQSLTTVQAVLTDQVAALIEARPNDPVVLDALISSGGRFNLGNLAHILRTAAPQLNVDARPDLITDDWMANFKDKAKTCSDPDMATLWANLLAGEANSPGSHSRKTVNVLADLEPDDARLFKNAAMFRIVPVNIEYNKTSFEIKKVNPAGAPKLVIDQVSSFVYGDLDHQSLVRLEWLGLITNIPDGYFMQSHRDSSDAPRIGSWVHGSELFYVIDGDEKIRMGQWSFTIAGEELSKFCTPVETPTSDYIGFIMDLVWKPQNLRSARSLPEALAMGQRAQ